MNRWTDDLDTAITTAAVYVHTCTKGHGQDHTYSNLYVFFSLNTIEYVLYLMHKVGRWKSGWMVGVQNSHFDI